MCFWRGGGTCLVSEPGLRGARHQDLSSYGLAVLFIPREHSKPPALLPRKLLSGNTLGNKGLYVA